VLAVTANNAAEKTGPRRITTYPPPVGRYFEATIWEAARATSAAPLILKPISIGPEHFAEVFVDAGLGYNNPVFEVISEAEKQFPDDSLACIISIGTGIPKQAKYKAAGIPKDIIDTLIKISTNCEAIEKHCADKFANLANCYFRFNVQQGLADVGLDDWSRLGEVKTLTLAFLAGEEARIKAVARILHTRPPRMPISQLSMLKISIIVTPQLMALTAALVDM
jgi:predicted acylesterase/phospholipase RssA